MSDTDTMHVHDDVLELASLLRPTWHSISAGIRASGVPTCEGEDPKPPADDPADPPADPPEKDHAAEADKWKALARKHEAQAKANAEAAKKLADLEEADKTEIQKAADRATDAEKRATDAEAKALRIEVALDKAPEGMALAQVRKLANRLAGNTKEELEADAVELFEDFTPDKGNDDPPRRPKERLRSGAVPDAEPDEVEPGIGRLMRAYAQPSKQ